jgi:hypothetical protein
MRPANILAYLALLTVSLTGCSAFHKQTPPQAPPLQTGQGELEEKQKQQNQGPPAATLPQPSAQTAPPQLPPAKPRKVKKSKKKPSPATPPAPSPAIVADAAHGAEGTSNAASPIGELTTGDSAEAQQTKHDTTNLIAQTEQGLAGIKHPLSGDQQTTAEQIRTFLKQAQMALDNGDTEGAHTLATKAKLLLDELTKQ